MEGIESMGQLYIDNTRGAKGDPYREDEYSTDDLIKILRELCKIDSYYYDSVYEYLKDINQSTIKRRKND